MVAAWGSTFSCQTAIIREGDVPLDISKKDIVLYIATYPVGQAYGVIVRYGGRIYHHGVPLNVLKECQKIEEQFPNKDIIQLVESYGHSDFAKILDGWFNEEYYNSGVPLGVRHIIRAAFQTVTGTVIVVCEPSPSSYAAFVYIDGVWIRWYRDVFRTAIGQIAVSGNGLYVNNKLLPRKEWEGLWRLFTLANLKNMKL